MEESRRWQVLSDVMQKSRPLHVSGGSGSRSSAVGKTCQLLKEVKHVAHRRAVREPGRGGGLPSGYPVSSRSLATAETSHSPSWPALPGKTRVPIQDQPRAEEGGLLGCCITSPSSPFLSENAEGAVDPGALGPQGGGRGP